MRERHTAGQAEADHVAGAGRVERRGRVHAVRPAARSSSRTPSSTGTRRTTVAVDVARRVERAWAGSQHPDAAAVQLERAR